MMIKTDNIEFQSFSDGICDIYTEDEEGNKTYKYTNLGFDNRKLGYNRVFAAKAVQVQVNAVIRIPLLDNIDIHDIVEIKNVGKYDIVLTQNADEANPPSLDITLQQLEMFQVIS